MDEKKEHEIVLSSIMKKVIVWGAIFGGGAVGVSYIIFIIYWTWQEEGWVKDIVKEHFAATIGLPLSAIGAFLLVTVLRISAGNIEFKGVGFEFKGASGPVILWIFCFLAIAAGIKLLW